MDISLRQTMNLMSNKLREKRGGEMDVVFVNVQLQISNSFISDLTDWGVPKIAI